MHLVVESSAEPLKPLEFVGWRQQACMALQTAVRETPAPARLILNGARRELLL